MWIYPLIVLILLIGIFHFIDGARRINQSLQNKRQYYGLYRIKTIYTKRGKLMMGLVLVVLITLIVFVTLPYTRGSIKSLTSGELDNYYKHYYCEESRSDSQVLFEKIDSSKLLYSSQKVGQRIVFISGNKLISKTISNDNPKELSYEYNDLSNAQIKIFKEYILLYKNYDGYAKVSIHKIDDLSFVEEVTVFGKIEMIVVNDDKLQFAINRKIIYDDLPIINLKKSGNCIYADKNEYYYIPNNYFYQVLTIIEVDIYNNYIIKSICLNDYYLLEKGNSVYVATNIYKGNSKKACIMRYSKDLIWITLMKETLDGELYKEPVINGDNIICYTAIFGHDNNKFIRTTLNDYLFVIDKTTYNGTFNQTALKVSGQIVFVEQQNHNITFADDKDQSLELNVNEVNLVNQDLFQVINEENEFKVYKINYNGKFDTQIIFFDNVQYDEYNIYSYEENIYLVYQYQDKIGYKVKNINDNYVIDNQYEKSNGYQICVIDSEIVVVSNNKTTSITMK